MASYDTAGRARETSSGSRAWMTAMLSLGVVVLVAYSSYRKPLWYDEFVHFALGGLSAADAFQVFIATTDSVNHGQTGVYIMLDWLLLQVFGPSTFALRLPSLVAAAGLLAAGVWFLRLKGCSRGWQALGLVALASQTLLMFHTGDARPYMPLAASTVGMLTYYSVPLGQRSSGPIRALGVISLLGGALMHAYFPLMLTLVVGYTAWLAIRAGELRFSAPEVARFLNPALFLSAAVAYLAIGQVSWLRASPDFDLDPYFWLVGPGETVVALLGHHLEFLIGLPVALLLTVLASISVKVMPQRADLLGPLALLAAGLLSSTATTLLSIVRSYWVFPRQWVAGIALVALAIVWLFSVIHQASERQPSLVLRAPTVVFRAVVVAALLLAMVEQARLLASYRVQWESIDSLPSDRATPEMPPEGAMDVEWVRVANINIKTGGRVWPSLAEYYTPYLEGREVARRTTSD